jgi:hypothetical protein
VQITEISICSICLEPIWNFICIGCLKKSIEKWIKSKELLQEFKKFHEKLEDTFSSGDRKEFCIRCHTTSGCSICPYCYTKEVYTWLKEKSQELAEKFWKIFNFNFEGSDISKNPRVKNLQPVIFYPRDILLFSICENCEKPSEFLKKVNGSWLCEECREET